VSGRAWVAGQLALIGATIAAGLRAQGRPGPLRTALAGIAAGSGVALVAAGGSALGDALTPLPEPVPGAGLREDGAYAALRHPIYGGLILLALGWTFARGPRAVAPALALALFLDRKARHEEELLASQHPGYDEYRRRVPRRLVPSWRR
jgi:protein-S-isoprenylcysteine O-methyltransferase Ste14